MLGRKGLWIVGEASRYEDVCRLVCICLYEEIINLQCDIPLKPIVTLEGLQPRLLSISNLTQRWWTSSRIPHPRPTDQLQPDLPKAHWPSITLQHDLPHLTAGPPALLHKNLYFEDPRPLHRSGLINIGPFPQIRRPQSHYKLPQRVNLYKLDKTRSQYTV